MPLSFADGSWMQFNSAWWAVSLMILAAALPGVFFHVDSQGVVINHRSTFAAVHATAGLTSHAKGLTLTRWNTAQPRLAEHGIAAELCSLD
jgi:hypothetical protein